LRIRYITLKDSTRLLKCEEILYRKVRFPSVRQLSPDSISTEHYPPIISIDPFTYQDPETKWNENIDEDQNTWLSAIVRNYKV
jgi:hypothetical protein